MCQMTMLKLISPLTWLLESSSCYISGRCSHRTTEFLCPSVSLPLRESRAHLSRVCMSVPRCMHVFLGVHMSVPGKCVFLSMSMPRCARSPYNSLCGGVGPPQVSHHVT